MRRSDIGPRRAVVVDRLVERNVALKKVLEVYRRGVCLIHGTYVFKMDVDSRIVPVPRPDGSPLELEYIGSGFPVDTGGPAFGPDGSVIGVDSAITADFDGSNFGVPIRYVRKMLP